MKILLLSRYDRLGASSRVRSFQYLPFLEANGWQVDVSPLFSDSYLQAFYRDQPRGVHAFSGYWNRLKGLLDIKQYDLLWIEKELFPFLPPYVESGLKLLGIPYVVDYDDAIYHRYDCHRNWLIRKTLGRKIDTVMRGAALVIAGNDYLAQRAFGCGSSHVEIVPTVVDVEHYRVVAPVEREQITIGWIGSKTTAVYLDAIIAAITKVAEQVPIRLVTVGAAPVGLSVDWAEAWEWTEASEVESIQAFDIGIMPLPDEPWERGKCGYKLIQYMACGLPVIGSPVGVNDQIIDHGVNGFMARSVAEWEDALLTLIKDRGLRSTMGLEGRKRVEDWYSLQVQAPRLERILRQICVQ